MSRYRSYTRKILLLLGAALLIFHASPADAASCRRDSSCTRALETAALATTEPQRLASIVELQTAYARVPDPRLLVSIGKLQQRVGQVEKAKASCVLAQSLAHSDSELQQQAKDCIITADAALLPSNVTRASPTTSHVEAKSGSVHAKAAVYNTITVSPQITMAPQLHLAPQIHVIQHSAPAPTTERAPVYRRWWFWAGVGVVAAGAVGLGIGLATREPNLDGYQKYPLALLTM